MWVDHGDTLYIIHGRVLIYSLCRKKIIHDKTPLFVKYGADCFRICYFVSLNPHVHIPLKYARFTPPEVLYMLIFM
jgi:hypothetical protein